MGKSSINGPSAITMLNSCNCKAKYTRREVPKKPKIHSTSTPFLKQFPTHQETSSLQIPKLSILNQPKLSILGWLSGVFMLFKRKEPPKLLKQDQPWTPKRIQCVRTEEVAQGHRFCTITIAIGCEKTKTTTTYIVLLLFPIFFMDTHLQLETLVSLPKIEGLRNLREFELWKQTCGSLIAGDYSRSVTMALSKNRIASKSWGSS